MCQNSIFRVILSPNFNKSFKGIASTIKIFITDSFDIHYYKCVYSYLDPLHCQDSRQKFKVNKCNSKHIKVL